MEILATETKSEFVKLRSDWRDIADECGFDIADTKEALEAMRDNDADFEISGYRFIHDDKIDEIMCEELSGDTYMLGCFNAGFLAGILGTSTDAIEAIQKAEAFEGLGEMILAGNHLAELQQAYVSADGFGHHFNSYDGGEIELNGYHIFQS
jgi:hypothetical protein